MKTSTFTSAICMAAVCLLPVVATADKEPPSPVKPSAKAKTTVEELKEITHGMVGVLDTMVSALEKAKDKESAELAAKEIVAATKTMNELASSGRKLKALLTESDKLELEQTDEEQFSMQKIKGRSEKAFAALSEKPELLEILQPALIAFSSAAKAMYMEAASASPPPIRARDKKSSNVE
jgi:hypothetical protein